MSWNFRVLYRWQWFLCRSEIQNGRQRRSKLLWKPMNYIFVISLRTTERNLTNLTLRVFTMRYYTSVVSLVQIDRRLWTFWLIDFQEPLKALSGEIYWSSRPPHYLSHPSSPSSSSLPFSLLPLSHPHYFSPSFLSVILTTSPSFIPLNPPPHYLSSLSCNIIIHFITSVFLPSSFSLLTFPNYLLRILFSSVVIIILLITSSSLLLFSSFTFVTSSFLYSSFKSPLHYLFHYFLILLLLTISILFHIDSLHNSSPSSSLFYTSISPSSPSSFYHSPSVLSILLFIFLPSYPLPHTCQLCLPALSKRVFFTCIRKIALSLKSVFPSFPPTSLSVLTPCSCLP